MNKIKIIQYSNMINIICQFRYLLLIECFLDLPQNVFSTLRKMFSRPPAKCRVVGVQDDDFMKPPIPRGIICETYHSSGNNPRNRLFLEE